MYVSATVQSSLVHAECCQKVTLGKSDKPDIFQCSGMGELQLSSSATSSGHAESIKAVTTGSTLQTGILGVGYNLNASGKPQPLQAVQLTDTDTNTQLTGTFLAAGQAALFVFVQDPVTGQMGISLLASYEDVPDRVTLGFLQVKTV